MVAAWSKLRHPAEMLKLAYKLGNIRGEKRQEFKQALWQVQVQSIQTSVRLLANENARQPACAANAKDPLWHANSRLINVNSFHQTTASPPGVTTRGWMLPKSNVGAVRSNLRNGDRHPPQQPRSNSRAWGIVGIVGGLIAIVFSILSMTGHGLHLLHRWHH